MQVRRLCWLGVRADAYEQTLGFFRDLLGLRVEFEHLTTAELSAPSGDRVQVFAPGDAYYDFFGRYARGPVALFEVDDVRAARRELEHAGIEVLGDIKRDETWEWLHLVGPDGNLYELASAKPNTCS